MLKYIVAFALVSFGLCTKTKEVMNFSNLRLKIPNSCITFSVSSGTGCAWMCNYCATNLKTNNYYFTNGICQYESGGCVGNPLPNTQYTCCSI
jgi:hypothetical protein